MGIRPLEVVGVLETGRDVRSRNSCPRGRRRFCRQGGGGKETERGEKNNGAAHDRPYLPGGALLLTNQVQSAHSIWWTNAVQRARLGRGLEHGFGYLVKRS